MANEPAPRAKAGAKAKRDELSPVVLIPTPAQLASGVRVIDVGEEIYPRAVVLAVARAHKCGWGSRVTYSQFLDVPPFAGKHKGQWVTKHCLRVRCWRDTMRVEASWIGTDEDGWKFDSAQAFSAGFGLTQPLSSDVFGKLIDGRMALVQGKVGADVAETGQYAAV